MNACLPIPSQLRAALLVFPIILELMEDRVDILVEGSPGMFDV